MATKRRPELKSLFKNGSVPTAQHFADLIDSTLNKRDDHFFGLWQPGTAYYPGEVVIYGKSIYMLLGTVTKQPPPKVVKGAPVDPQTEPGPYCSAITPDKDTANWCMLDFDLQDEDWTIVKDSNIMYATNLLHNVGIGTDCPMAKLHVEEKEHGKLEFDPHESPYYAQKQAELRITAFDLPDCKPAEYLSLHLDPDFAHAETNTKNGFSFDQAKPVSVAQKGQKNGAEPDIQVLMVVTSEGEKAEVGIGIKEPVAALHVSSPNQGEWLVNPSGGKTAETRLAANREKITHKLEDNFAKIETDATQGFRFLVESNVNKSNPGLPVVIDENNHLGVGTETPAAHLEVMRSDCGSVQTILDQINPAFALINLKPTGKNTYLTVGADNSFAVLKTDAPCGFVFKRGDAHGTPGNPERNINQGEGQVFIDQDGKVGIGTAPDGYELDVCGREVSFEAYLAHDQCNIHNTSYLKENEGLDIVCRLHPMRFKWRENLGNVVSRENEQFGLPDFECADVVPEVVRITGKDEKAIAYQNLVPVLIKAIQEQQKMIDDLKRAVENLK